MFKSPLQDSRVEFVPPALSVQHGTSSGSGWQLHGEVMEVVAMGTAGGGPSLGSLG